MAGVPEAKDFGGGLRGYSSGDLFEQARAEFEARNPQQAAAYNRLFKPYGTPETNPNNPGDMNAPGFVPPAGTPEYYAWVASQIGNFRF